MKLLLGSNNPKKRGEISRLLAHLDMDVVTPTDVDGIPEVDEDQTTFEGNAAKKAKSAAHASGLWSLADDSGLEVEAFDALANRNLPQVCP